MFIGKKKLIETIEGIFSTEKIKKILGEVLSDETKVPALKTKIQELKDEIADLQTTKKQELRDIEHLVKIKESKLDIEHQKKELTLKTEYKDREMALQKDYFDKVMEQVNTAKKDMSDIYQQILMRLPNVNASLEIKRK